MTTYIIPECNLATLETAIEKLNRRCERLNLDAITVTKELESVKARVMDYSVQGKVDSVWLKPEEMTAAHKDTGERMAWYTVTVEGSKPTLNGWEFVAILEPLTTDDGQVENLVSNLPGKLCPSEYRNIIGKCNHCNTTRRRSQTFVVQSADGYKCVGRQCLKDFLGYHADPEALAKQAELLTELATACSMAEYMDEEGSYRTEANYSIDKFLTATATVIRVTGWMSRGQAYEQNRISTADRVLFLLNPGKNLNSEEKSFIEAHQPTDCDKTTASAAAEWCKAISETEREGSDYIANINLVARVGYITRKTAGLGASIIVAHAKHIEREIERQRQAAKPESQWIGTEGERIKGPIVVTCEKVIAKEGMYGTTGIHSLTTADGSDLVWFASGSSSSWMEAGQSYHVSLTVTRHGEFKGRKQTTVNRVTVWTAEEVEKHQEKEAKKAAKAAKAKK